ncbi:hypothetical protein FB567DRAFT_532437 [Paraphoma chrysanthemicola]|uniref:Pathway-specific nitrogen regulator n=1 Tax=Paraphoma chrysanthemicola TaxID=798071 RepID=A0A8K0VVZ1_9PLEO|nr:hypothetical protein FB567DRAFT_532437 [Paraphoma chrysanthemicola]
MATMHRSPGPGLTSFAIYEDPEDQQTSSPTDSIEEDMSFNSELSLPTADDAISSIELDDEPQPYKSSYTSRRSSLQPRRSSGVTHYSVVSAIPSESSIATKPIPQANEADDARYTPRKERPRFRNPESVRAMQMASPPLLPTIETSQERLKGSYKLMTPSRSGRSETPVSKKTRSRRGSVRDQHSPRPTPTPQQAPLVLLHVTILPPQVPYSHDLMVRIMPEWLVENYKLLDEKLQDIILMRRGLLIPHPRDEYDLLEERILESLELKTPRLLKCGHFVAPDEYSDDEDEGYEASAAGDSTGRGSRMSGGTFTEEQEWMENPLAETGMCTDCNCELKRPGRGVGAGKRRWDIKIYAANGLMRAAGWTACWNDMERCDVEISPWIPLELRKTLERRVQEEQEAEKRKQMYALELQRQIQESTSKQKIAEEEAAERKRLEEAELQKSFEAAAAALQRSVEEKAAEKKRFEDALEEKIEEAKESLRVEIEAQTLAEANIVTERLRALEQALEESKVSASTSESAPATTQPTKQKGHLRAADIPLGTLLKNYLLILLKDQRNFIILLLGATVVFLSMNMQNTPQLANLSTLPETKLIDSVTTVAVTTTATTTATSFSTLTVTHIQTAVPVKETTLPESISLQDPRSLTRVEPLNTPTPSASAEDTPLQDYSVQAPAATQDAQKILPIATLQEESLPAPQEETVSATDNVVMTAKHTCRPLHVFQPAFSPAQ